MLSAFTPVIGREVLTAARRPSDALGGLLFFIVVASLFPLAVGPDPALLLSIGPGVVWVAALLAVVISLHRVFQPDLEDGSLEQMLLSPSALGVIVSAKVVAHWLLGCLPLVAVAPLLALQYGLGPESLLALLASLLLGTPTLALLGAFGAALTLGLRGHALLALIVLPLCVPVLIFGSSAVSAAGQGLPVGPQLSLLGACLSLSVFLCPWATGAALRLAVE
ncbi:heme exporter protein CcmB [Ramlibacter solisilvae]|uniref:Heme exporter protein B n=1 Tax=Ramlibacter tataouinensis TaxID=94132 RepID=A0A127JYN5_9BURK|nr:heme exporter protein CcmB [Ramlibacter tataouinensis]AMO25039.1 heme ABC transporter permease [Ramlibacter tataouinensis]